MIRFPSVIAVLFIGVGLALPTVADDKHHPKDDAKPAAVAVSAAPMTEGEVRKVDKAAGKVTIKQGPIPNLDMPATTMAYRAKDKTMLDRLKPGDKIKFESGTVAGEYMVLRIEKVK